MSDFHLRFDPVAENDIASAFRWYRERSVSAAEGFRTAVFDGMERIGHAPLVRGPDALGNRKLVLHRFPYTIWYVVDGDQVTVVAVAHHRRQPAYWRKKPA
ncbi:type II toxin-antitoxin system RelE/ParE family toxin [Rhizobacter sp. P5_C2]